MGKTSLVVSLAPLLLPSSQLQPHCPPLCPTVALVVRWWQQLGRWAGCSWRQAGRQVDIAVVAEVRGRELWWEDSGSSIRWAAADDSCEAGRQAGALAVAAAMEVGPGAGQAGMPAAVRLPARSLPGRHTRPATCQVHHISTTAISSLATALEPSTATAQGKGGLCADRAMGQLGKGREGGGCWRGQADGQVCSPSL